MGMYGNGVMIGQLFYDGNLNRDDYLRILNEEIVPQLHIVPALS